MTALARGCPATIHEAREQWLSMRRRMRMPYMGYSFGRSPGSIVTSSIVPVNRKERCFS
jgi:hypothetical protein